MIQIATDDDDFIHHFSTTVVDMSPDNLIFRERADWRKDLKPTIQQSNANLSFLFDFSLINNDEQQDFDNAS